MSNTFFKFKKFTIHQDVCAMKVTTDGCLFGAIVANEYKNLSCDKKALDIGTGTGLLTLMLAQANPCIKIDAIEIDASATTQAQENINTSPWLHNIQVIETDLRRFHPPYKYDIIICNPPFHENQLISDNTLKNKAHHSSHLSLRDLIKQARNLLKKNGQLYILMPYYRTEEAIKIALKHCLHCTKIIYLKHAIQREYFRSILQFGSNEKADTYREQLFIKQDDGDYSPTFKNLLQDYYLHL